MRWLFACAASVVLAAGCVDKPPHDCSGAAIDVILRTQVDAGTDAGFTGADGGQQPKPACSGDCRDYRAALAQGINANVPTATCTSFGSTVVECLPASERSGCPSNTIASAEAIQPAIASYLASEWPELGADGGLLAVDYCPCRIY